MPPDSGAFRNPPTWVPLYFGAQPPRPPPPMGLAAAYSIALRLERERPPLEGAGYRLYWMTAGQIASRDVRITGASHVVLGRHTACDAVLLGDESIALRHMLVRSTLLDDGCPRLTALDLESGTGFLLPDGTRQRSIVATGPFAIQVGSYAVVALPGGVALPEQMPAPLCAPADGQGPRVSQHAVSRITLMPSALWLADRPTLAGLPWGQPAARAYEYELMLWASSGRVSVYFSKAELERGLLIGRALKCLDAGLRAILTLGISRVHLLLLRDGGECRAYDLASTQGTYQHGRHVRQVTLEDEGTTLDLGTSTGIRLGWRRVVPRLP